MQDNLQIPYGIFDFKRIRTEGYYYIDKTGYIPALEQSGSFLFFVRPRRFGKSLFINMLRCYYDLAEKDNFEKLFGGLAIAGPGGAAVGCVGGAVAGGVAGGVAGHSGIDDVIETTKTVIKIKLAEL